MITRKTHLLAVALAAIVGALGAAPAFAEIDQLSLNLRAQEYRVGGRLLVRLFVTTRLNQAPNRREGCDLSIWSKLSFVGDTTGDQAFRLVTRRRTTRRVNSFFFQGTPVQLISGRQTQLNLQSIVTCKRDGVSGLTSNVDASNVTATRGTSRASFTRALQRGLR